MLRQDALLLQWPDHDADVTDAYPFIAQDSEQEEGTPSTSGSKGQAASRGGFKRQVPAPNQPSASSKTVVTAIMQELPSDKYGGVQVGHDSKMDSTMQVRHDAGLTGPCKMSSCGAPSHVQLLSTCHRHMGPPMMWRDSPHLNYTNRG